MHINQQNDIPKSIIKGSGIVSADLNSLNGRGEILFVDPQSFVVGLDGKPYMLLATPEFTQECLPANIRKEIYEIRKLVLQPSYFIAFDKNVFCNIPRWLTEFKNIEYLRFENIQLDNIIHLADLQIEHLVLENVRYNDSVRIVNTIKSFKNLKKVSYDQSLSTEIINCLKELNIDDFIANDLPTGSLPPSHSL